MSKVAIVYWSGTGNTEAMANYVAEGVKKAGGEADLFTSAEFGADKAGEYDRIAFGCPSMGAEQLEESEFQPMFDEVSPVLSGKKIALFDSTYAFARASPSASHSAPAASSGVALQITGSQAMVTPRVMQSLSQVRIHSPSPHP